MPVDKLDPRYSLANERTFLAWIRTALGLLAGAAAVLAVDVSWPDAAVRGIAVALAIVGGSSAVMGWYRWRGVQRALETGEVAPTPRGHVILPAAVLAVAVTIVIVAAI
jgi:putative membrane protein